MTRTIQQLFAKPVDRPIDGVIKADDVRNLETELDEYVVTRDVIKGLGAFTDSYLHDPSANGVWISGFYGSGKSHLLKMLSLMLDSERRIGEHQRRPAEILLPKVEDEIIRADLRKAITIPARSLLFNIALKHDGIGGDHKAPVLEVFMKVLNELQGYFGKQGYVAQFEHDLNKRDQLESFKQTYQRLNCRSWESDREAVITVTKSSFAKAYAELFGGSDQDAIGVIGDAKETYRLSIESFAERVKDYLDTQVPGFRLNFFVDEVGEFIGEQRPRLLELQTIVESLATTTNGRASVFITSQSDLEGVIGNIRFEQADDLSKIQGRFKTKLTLASADVQEVIQRRLLAKDPDEPEELIEIYGKEKDNLQTLFRFGDNSLQLKGWSDCQSFCGLYPFHPYQLSLFQQAIQSLATHNIFEGRNMATGERSMLSVFQEVAKAIKALPVGRLASFDLLYDGIRAAVRGDKQQTIVLAQDRVGPLELRILKALFLLKWVPQFKGSLRNIAILLIDAPDLDIQAHEQAVKDALTTLDNQSYLQRSGDLYEFLTDKEKDVEQEIKRTDVLDSQVLATLHATVFADVLKTNKIRYDANGQDYTFAQKIDDGLIKGKDTDVTVNLVTPEHPNYGSEAILHSRNMGGTELMAILPEKGRLTDLIRTYLKTEAYIRQNSGGENEDLNAILINRGKQNSARRQEINHLVGDQLRKAVLVLNGQTLEVGEGEPVNRFSKAYQKLIESAYPKLKMIHGLFNEASVAKVVEDLDDLIEGMELQLSEAEQEVFTEVERQQKLGQRISAADLAARFEARPYGWGQWATLTFLGRLFRLGKVELREKELLSTNEVVDALTNSRRLAGVMVRKQEVFDAQAINDLKRFHMDFFGPASTGTDARTTCEAFRAAMVQEAEALREIAAKKDAYPFMAAVEPMARKALELSTKDDPYLLNDLQEYRDELLDAQEDTLTPIKEFLKGNQKGVYDEVRAFVGLHADDLQDLPQELTAPLTALVEAATPYRGGLIPQANGAMAQLKDQLQQRLQEAQAVAVRQIEDQEAKLKAESGFLQLEAAEQEQVLKVTTQAKADVQNAASPGRVSLRVTRYCQREYPAQLQRLATLVAPSEVDEPPIPVIPASSLKVSCSLGQITNDQELQQWLEALRSAAQAELDKGHRISL